MIRIDGKHLYDKYIGTMLVVVGVDANVRLFPLVFAIMKGESTRTVGVDSWFVFG